MIPFHSSEMLSRLHARPNKVAMAKEIATSRSTKIHHSIQPDKRLSSLRRALSFLQEDQQSDGQSSANGVNDIQESMKKHSGDENVDSDTASTVATSDYSSESVVEDYLYEVADSPTRSFSLDDARVAISYVHGKMKHDEKFQQFQYRRRHASGSETYSTFGRPEKSIDSDMTVLPMNSNKETINVYNRRGSISMIEDSQVEKILPAKGNTDCHVSLASSPLSNGSSKKVMFPSLPPTKPPPLHRRHTSVSRKHNSEVYRRTRSCPSSAIKDDARAVKDDDSSNFAYDDKDDDDDDDDTSIMTHVAIANMSVIVDLGNSNDDLTSDGTTWT